MKEHRHLGVYGLVIENNKILLIKKGNGPYTGILDLPGGSIEFKEKPENALIREFKEETNLDIISFKLFDCNSITYEYTYLNDLYTLHHIGIFYKILDYKNNVSKNIDIDNINDDSLGADFYDIDKLSKNKISPIVLLELEKLGYKIK